MRIYKEIQEQSILFRAPEHVTFGWHKKRLSVWFISTAARDHLYQILMTGQDASRPILRHVATTQSDKRTFHLVELVNT